MRLHFNHGWLNVQGTKRIDILLKNKYKDNTQKILCFSSIRKKYTTESVRRLFLDMSFK